MSEHQLRPNEPIDENLLTKENLPIFIRDVLGYKGRITTENSGSAPLPENYPYKTRMQRKQYEAEKKKLQIELLKVQSWVKDTGQRIVCLFEGRDAAGKGGTINRFMEHSFHLPGGCTYPLA